MQLQITSLSESDDDEDYTIDDTSNLNDEQRVELKTHGYCTHDPLENTEVADTVRGFIRLHATRDFMLRDVVRIIVDFYYWQFDSRVFVELVCSSEEVGCGRQSLVVPRRNLALSKLLSTRVEAGAQRIELEQVNTESMRKVLGFLNHHGARAPAPIARPIRSVKMARICEDPWDAQFMDGCTRKMVFKIILAANYLDCPSLLHLGCAKIATLIKGKSPEEIKSILADQE